MRIIFPALLMLTACGAADQGASPEVAAEKSAKTQEKNEGVTNDETTVKDQSILAGGEGQSGIAILLFGQSLPACETANRGQTFYVQANDLFQSCDVDGWKVVDLRGAAGATGAKGDKGDAGEKGDTGAAGLDGSTSAQGAQGIQGAAGATGAQGVQGATGSQGATGATGAQGVAGAVGSTGTAGATGATGTAGTNGLNGLSAVGLYQASGNKFIGTSLGGTTLVFSNGGLADLNIGTGTFYASYAYFSDQAAVAYCTFATTDCSGSCYVNNLSTNITGLMKGTVFYNGSSWVKVTGSESNAGAMTIRSAYVNGACVNSFGTKASATGFLVNTPWTMPNTLSMPLGAIYLDIVH